MILLRDFDYSDAVIDGHSGHGADILSSVRVADALNINELRLYFLYPEWASGRWHGMRQKASNATPMLRFRTKSGDIEHIASDGTEYREPAPLPIMKNGKVVGYQRMPWRRTSPKAVRPGRARRDDAQLHRYVEVAA